jgi:hypothetical protein
LHENITMSLVITGTEPGVGGGTNPPPAPPIIWHCLRQIFNGDISCFLSDDKELVLKALLLADMIYMSDEEEEGEEEECPICTDPLHGDIHRWAWQEVKVTKIIVPKIHRWAWHKVEVTKIMLTNIQTEIFTFGHGMR